MQLLVRGTERGGTWMRLLGRRKGKAENLNLDRSSLLFFFSEDLSYAAAPTKTPTSELRWDSPCKSAVNLASPWWVSIPPNFEIYSFTSGDKIRKTGSVDMNEKYEWTWQEGRNMNVPNSHCTESLTQLAVSALRAALNLSAFPDTHPALVL